MMKQNPILITGGTGTVGSRIASRLIKLGYRVRIASRKKGELVNAEYVYFDWKEASSYTPAIEQVKDIYLVAPVGVLDPAPYVLPFLKEAKRLGVERVVMQSASVVSENGPVFGALHQAVREFPEWTVLRPSYFMQNFINVQHQMSIQNEGRIVTASGEGKLGFIDADDIAETAVRALTDAVPHQTHHILTGPEALSYAEAAEIIGAAAGRRVKHVSISRSELQNRMAAAGLPADYASFMAGLDEAISHGAEHRVTDTVKRVTGKEPRSLSEFAAAHAAYWN
ncbi:NmrA family NAD(P)-binding protein [Bacillus stercoris]|uniref:NmrA family NAD(P)-binding protein n=1 Tax=Bacillus stercoris TaxID=2054641 RepID=UPI002DBA33B9|nr:NmrA family NAD(P)-binding protein [Bacillus stercoris]MEC3617109.1 NmrA family NAD(P)-binding protein [Bacillus stercoris]